MDFTPTDEQQAITDLAQQVIGGTVDPDRLAKLEAEDIRVDTQLWSQLVEAGLVGIALPESAGGAGLGMVELGIVLRAQGVHVAKVPLWSCAVGAWALAEHGGDAHADLVASVLAGDTRVTIAAEEFGQSEPAAPTTTATDDGGWSLTGTKAVVNDLPGATAVLVTAATDAGARLFLVDPLSDGVTVERTETTGLGPTANLALDGAAATPVGEDGVVTWLLDRVHVALAWLQSGVAAGALARTATYVSEREQFGRPLGTFQAVAHKIADCHIDAEAMHVTALQAAWALDNDTDPSTAVPVATWWASSGGDRVVHTVMHLHGGMGVDLDHPIHRYLLLGREVTDSFGGPSQELDRLGDLLDDLPVLA